METNGVKDALDEDEWALVALALLALGNAPTADEVLHERLLTIAMKLGLEDRMLQIRQAFES